MARLSLQLTQPAPGVGGRRASAPASSGRRASGRRSTTRRSQTDGGWGSEGGRSGSKNSSGGRASSKTSRSGSKEGRRKSSKRSSISQMPSPALDFLVQKHGWLNNPKVLWRHPLARIAVALLILLLDMLLFLEDPITDSHVPAFLPGLGHIYGLLFSWPDSAGLGLLRVVLLLISLVSGCWLGRQVLHHRILRDHFGLQMFSGHNGTLFTMGCCCVGTLLIGCMAYNMFTGTSELNGSMGMTMRDFCRMAQCCSVTADIVTILMILDQIFQDRYYYGDWLPRAKYVWCELFGGWVRVVTFWLLLASSCALTYYGILNAGVGDSYNDSRLGGLTESARTLMVSAIIICDLFTVAQDWEFPSFQKDFTLSGDVLIGGTFVTTLHCDMLTRLLQRLPPMPKWCQRFLPSKEFFTFQMSGTWLTYGPLLIVIGIDLFCTKTQVMYEPEDYGQYIRGGSGDEAWRVWTIRDEAYLAQAYSKGYLVKPDWVTFAARWNATTGDPIGQSGMQDFELKSQHTSNVLRYLCPIPGIAAMLLFAGLVAYGNRRRLEVAKRSVSPVDMSNSKEADGDRVKEEADEEADGSRQRQAEEELSAIQEEGGGTTIAAVATEEEPRPPVTPGSLPGRRPRMASREAIPPADEKKPAPEEAPGLPLAANASSPAASAEPEEDSTAADPRQEPAAAGALRQPGEPAAAGSHPTAVAAEPAPLGALPGQLNGAGSTYWASCEEEPRSRD